jgi:CubicO group peptidase (beta-lactamase class C family)
MQADHSMPISPLKSQAAQDYSGKDSSGTREFDRDIAERIRRVENGVRSRFQVRGATVEKWNVVEWMQEHHVVGLSLAVINDGKIEWAKGYGCLEVGSPVPVTASTIFQAGCISKAIAAVVALQLVRRGVLDLDEDINRRLKSWKLPENEHTAVEKVSVRRLLSHKAGLSVCRFNGGYPSDGPIPGLPQLLDGREPAKTGPVRVERLPGVEWRYSNGGYMVLQQLIEDATGKPFATAAKCEVFEPFGMLSSSFAYEPPYTAASGHGPDQSLVEGKWRYYPDLAASGLWTNALDLARFLIILQQSFSTPSVTEPFASKSVHQMLSLESKDWGLGVHVRGIGDDLCFEHGGRTTGYRSLMFGYASRGQGVVLMSNSEGGASNFSGGLLRSLAGEYQWADFRVCEILPADQALYASLIGDYDLGGGAMGLVRIEGGRLFGTAYGRKSELLPLSQTEFLYADDLRICFERDALGRVSALVLEDGTRANKINMEWEESD